MDRLERNAKAAYLGLFSSRYDRESLDENRLVIYAHELDGCPWRSLARRVIPRLAITEWNHNLDRGDSFEQGWGLVHGVPTGLKMSLELASSDIVEALSVISDSVGATTALGVEERLDGKTVILEGTPDFMALEAAREGATLRILDAKSPRKPRTDDEGNYVLKASWRSRLETYMWMARRLYLGKDAGELAKELRRNTPWSIWPGWLEAEGAIKTIRGAVVLDTGESYAFLEAEVNFENIYKKLARRLLATRDIFMADWPRIRDDSSARFVSMANDKEWSRQCGYCPLADVCEVAKHQGIEVIPLENEDWKQVKTKKNSQWRETSRNMSRIKTTDEELVRTKSKVRIRGKRYGKDGRDIRVRTWSYIEPLKLPLKPGVTDDIEDDDEYEID